MNPAHSTGDWSGGPQEKIQADASGRIGLMSESELSMHKSNAALYSNV
jgi:hypothetical protein